jgi:hypothetical protein
VMLSLMNSIPASGPSSTLTLLFTGTCWRASWRDTISGSAVSPPSLRPGTGAVPGHSGSTPPLAVFQGSRETWTEMRSTAQKKNGSVGCGPGDNAPVRFCPTRLPASRLV